MKRALLVCCIGVLAPLSTLTAQDGSSDLRASWGIMAGAVSVTGGFSGALTGGPVGGIEGQVPLEARHLSLRADIMYSWIDTYHSGCGNSIEGGFCGYVDTWSRLISGSFSLVARLNDPAKRWSPYVFGGVAAYLTGNSDEPLTYLRPNHFGFQGGVGFDVRPNKHTYFVEAHYLGVAPGGFIPVVIGMRF
jgi:hypothetical protein